MSAPLLIVESMLPERFSIIGLMKSLLSATAPKTETANIRSQSDHEVSIVTEIRPGDRDHACRTPALLKRKSAVPNFVIASS